MTSTYFSDADKRAVVDAVNARLPDNILKAFDELDDGCALGRYCFEERHAQVFRLKEMVADAIFYGPKE